MQATRNKIKSSKPQQRVRELMDQLINVTDNLIEEFGEYRPEFLKSLRQAHEDVRRGRIRRIRSLKELL